MKRSVVATLTLCASTAGLAAFMWLGPSEIRHYTADELAELTCEALGERHEEVIFAYHDAELAYYRQTGAFHDDLGIPSEDVVPYAVLIKRFLRDHEISETDIADTSSTTPILSSDFFYAASTICATNPSWQATDAMRQAALNLGLIDE
ncbi:hypothetical protein [Tritonibacter mobilis]|uniref:hypothetical protein n=1 Tax=Tritonibacter mobilis TaxID=379347 RepID=UPI0014032B10|nr:hypothetical protein [Tritonibacter mobilis]NHM20953.1 hypothetical protein [Tritonibacter mobilis]NHM25103.1 hypothetical protein [Tritonibacter mobilis]